IRLPPLRQRSEDLLPLVEHFLEKLGATGDAGAPMRTQEFRSKIHAHTWPGNVRELRNYVERCLALKTQPPIDYPTSGTAEPMPDALYPLRTARQTFEKRYLEVLLERHGRNLSRAAHVAGVNRVNLYRMLWRHQLR